MVLSQSVRCTKSTKSLLPSRDVPTRGIRAHNPQWGYWQGYEWSPWHRIDGESGQNIVYAKGRNPAPEIPGLYRIRCTRHAGLEYIGMSATSLRARLYTCWLSAVHLESGGNATRHPYSEHLVAHARSGRQVSVSWTALDGLDKVELFGIECELIAAYRATRGRNPAHQFGVKEV